MYSSHSAHPQASGSHPSSSLQTHFRGCSIPPTCHSETACPVCQMYMDHFDMVSFESRYSESRQRMEERKLQVEVELLKRELSAARDREIALETAYDDLQMAYEEAVRTRTRSQGSGSDREQRDALHNDDNRDHRHTSGVGADYDADVDSDGWEVPPSPWIGSTPSSSANILSSDLSIHSGTHHASPAPSMASLAPSSSSPTSASSLSPSTEYHPDSEHESEGPALVNASHEDALRYGELLEQCDYNVKSANAVWREWKAAERERRIGDLGGVAEIEVFSEGSEDEDEEDEDENPDSEWEWEPYDYDFYERAASSFSTSSLGSISCSSAESIVVFNPAQSSDIRAAAPDVQSHSLPHPSPHLSTPYSLPCPIPADVKPTVYVDASYTGAGFCLCVPTVLAPTIDTPLSVTGSSSSKSKSMTCYWLTWKWAPNHPAIPLGVSGHIVMSWAELIALELGVHIMCAMKHEHMGRSSDFQSHSRSASYPSTSRQIHTPAPSIKRLTIHSDNSGVVTALSPAHHVWTPKHGLNTVVRRVLDTCKHECVNLDVRWVPSQANVADGPSKGKGVRACTGFGVVRAASSRLLGEGESKREWMDWVDAVVPLPDHLKGFVQKPTGGVVELLRFSAGEDANIGRRRRRSASNANAA